MFLKKICLGVVFFCLMVAGMTQPKQESFVSPIKVGQFQTVTLEWSWHGNFFNLTYDNMWHETLLMQFDNGDVATLTGYFAAIVPVGASYFAYMCNHYGKEVNEIAILIHNHIVPSEFSRGDIGFYEGIKRLGFKGLYLLYTPGGVVKKYLGDYNTMKLKAPWKKEE